MRRLLPLLVVGVLAGCHLFGSTVPDPFGGWYHLDYAGRVENLRFLDPNVLELRDLGCDQSFTVYQEWVSDGDALVATQSPGAPRFVPDPDVTDALQATPGMFGPDPERWLPGASCPVCPPGDAGVVACDTPQAVDAGI